METLLPSRTIGSYFLEILVLIDLQCNCIVNSQMKNGASSGTEMERESIVSC